jgi:glycosyltransferase involved in cell wall biosynthesis
MKILLVSNYGFDSQFPSRPEILQARALAQRGHHVVAYEYHTAGARRHEWLRGDVAVHRGSTWGFFSPELLLRLLLAEQPDIVHVHHLRNLLAFQATVLARSRLIPVVLTPHGLLHDGDLVADRERPLEAPLRFDKLLMTPGQLVRRLASGAHPRRAVRNYLLHAPLTMYSGIAALSQHERERLIELGIAPERITVLPNALDLSQFRAPAAEVQLPFTRPIILFIGQLVYRKGFDVLARAMPAVLARFPHASFVFISHNRQEEPTLRQLAGDAGALHAMHLLGNVSEPEKVRLLQSADLVVAPSRYEGFGIPIIEAMAAGRPLITTDAPAGNELVEHERTGLLVPYADHDALAAAIVRVLIDPALAERLGRNGRQQVVGRYDADTLATHLEAWYAAIRPLAHHTAL